MVKESPFSLNIRYYFIYAQIIKNKFYHPKLIDLTEWYGGKMNSNILEDRFNLIWNNQEILLEIREIKHICVYWYDIFMFSLRHITLLVCSNVTLPKPWIFYFKSTWWDYSEINLVWGENSFLRNIENTEVFRRVKYTESFPSKGKKFKQKVMTTHFSRYLLFILLDGIWPPALPNTQGCWARPLSHEELASWLKIMTPTWYQAAGAFNSC